MAFLVLRQSHILLRQFDLDNINWKDRICTRQETVLNFFVLNIIEIIFIVPFWIFR